MPEDTANEPDSHTEPQSPVLPPGDGSQPIYLLDTHPARKSEIWTKAELTQHENLMGSMTVEPGITLALAAINVAVFVVMIIGGIPFASPRADSLIPWGAGFGPLTTQGQWWRLVTAMFSALGFCPPVDEHVDSLAHRAIYRKVVWPDEFPGFVPVRRNWR